VRVGGEGEAEESGKQRQRASETGEEGGEVHEFFSAEAVGV
jgi:hypothetical protein